jgi:hypothetical protein
MRRVVIFVALWPLLAFLAVGIPGDVQAGRTAWTVLGLAYVFGAVPAVIMALVDGWIAKHASPLLRISATGIIGVLVIIVVLSIISTVHESVVLGFIPAALCSWLSWLVDKEWGSR